LASLSLNDACKRHYYTSQGLKMITKLKNFLKDESGQDVVEYSLLIVLIGTVALIYLTGLGLNIATLLQNIGAKLELVSNTTN
jgi:Flp pilus assembly pilin Flp